MSSPVIIIGAGAAGLSAAYSISQSGQKVVLLEARNRIGGRAFTDEVSGFEKPVERGAEFIHGQLPLTLSLLKEAGIAYRKTGGRMYSFRDGRQETSSSLFEHWEELMKKMKALQTDEPLGAFLDREFGGTDWQAFRAAIRNYAEGYDAADADRISVFALRNEWSHEDEGHQYRIEGGYVRLMDWLAEAVRKAGGEIHLGEVVRRIDWRADAVSIECENGNRHTGKCAVLAIPVGLWQAGADSRGHIALSPQIPAVNEAFDNIGMSGVVKTSLQFREAFWEHKTAGGQQYKSLGMLLSDAALPTWWTQAPDDSPVLTGWMAGPRATARISDSDDDLLREALQSLAYAMGRKVEELETQLMASVISNWTADPFSRGAYAWETPATPAARRFLMKGISDVLYFAGEALYEGTAMGTVEAALHSGREVAGKVMAGLLKRSAVE